MPSVLINAYINFLVNVIRTISEKRFFNPICHSLQASSGEQVLGYARLKGDTFCFSFFETILVKQDFGYSLWHHSMKILQGSTHHIFQIKI